MIQRIQTLYLVLAGIFPAFTLFFPVMLFYKVDTTLSMSAWGFTALTEAAAELPAQRPYALLALTVLSIIAAFVTVGGYKNRKNQLKQASWALALNLLWYVALALHTYLVCTQTGTSLAFAPCVLLPVLSLAAVCLAKRAIRRDEALVRAADRIR